MEELKKEQKIEILQNEITLQLSNRYVMTIRARVATLLKNKENLDICQKALERTEAALDILNTEMETLKKVE